MLVEKKVKVNNIETTENNDASEVEQNQHIFSVICDQKQGSLKRIVFFNKNPVEIIIDAGSPVSIINKNTAKFIINLDKLSPSNRNLFSYSKNKIAIAGEIEIELRYKSKTSKAKIVVVEQGQNLLGLPEINNLKIFGSYINKVDEETPYAKLVEKWSSEGLFSGKGHAK